MSAYVLPIIIFLGVLSPLYIPIGVTVWHAVAGRENSRRQRTFRRTATEETAPGVQPVLQGGVVD
ncbi:MAG TPA: hypothetical protein VIQ11_13845, partial [Mycobacterium sp.]